MPATRTNRAATGARRHWLRAGLVLTVLVAAVAAGTVVMREPPAEAPPVADLPDGGIALPSGRVVSFHDVIWGEPGPAGLTVRFRFLEPDLAEVTETMAYVDREADMQFLCETYAQQRIANTGPQPRQVVISISDAPVAFGEANPAVTQVFEAYSFADGACSWEGF